MKIVNVVGNRPHMVKTAVLSKVIRERGHVEKIVHTGQHYDYELSEIFIKELDIPQPDINLEVGSGSHAVQTAEMMVLLENTFVQLDPDVVLVHGDTNTTLAAALTAAKLKIPVAHVEAGLRSYDKTMPEEINRVCTDHVSSVLFCPVESAAVSARGENIQNCYLTGDVMLDTLRKFFVKDVNTPPLASFSGDVNVAIATIHRDENTNATTLREILQSFSEYDGNVIFPAHPRTRKIIVADGLEIPQNVEVIRPVGYLEMLNLVSHSNLVITDSGGLQKEAYILKIPCVTIRNNTEWPETFVGGWNRLVKNKTHHAISTAINNAKSGNAYVNCFGSGHASEKIVKILEEEFS